MHICFITNEYPKVNFPHGGVGTFIKSIARFLVKAGIQVSVVGINYTSEYEEIEDEGVKVYRLNARKIKGITWVLNSAAINKKLAEINKLSPIDIIEATELGLAFIQKKNDTNYIIRLNGGHHFFAESENRGINWWKGFQEKRSFSKADKIFGVSKYVINHTAKYIDFENKKGPVIYNPANFEKFHEVDNTKQISGRIFFAGTVSEKKGIKQLVQAFPMIKKKVPKAQLVIAGRDGKLQDGSSYISYLLSIIDPEIKEYIQFIGPVSNDDIPDLIEKAEVCVYPSHMEAMPLAWIEVMSMGKAFVASKTGPGPEVVKDGVTGLLCDPYDPADIADKTNRILMDKNLAANLGRNARMDILQRFDTQKILQQNISFYQSILAKYSELSCGK